MSGMANAIPFGPNNLPPSLTNHGGSLAGLTSQGGSNPGLTGLSALPTGGNNPLIAGQNIHPVSSVPEGSSVFCDV
jgi:hypothetical protein